MIQNLWRRRRKAQPRNPSNPNSSLVRKIISSQNYNHSYRNISITLIYYDCKFRWNTQVLEKAAYWNRICDEIPSVSRFISVNGCFLRWEFLSYSWAGWRGEAIDSDLWYWEFWLNEHDFCPENSKMFWVFEYKRVSCAPYCCRIRYKNRYLSDWQ